MPNFTVRHTLLTETGAEAIRYFEADEVVFYPDTETEPGKLVCKIGSDAIYITKGRAMLLNGSGKRVDQWNFGEGGEPPASRK